MHQYLVRQDYWSYIKGADEDQVVLTAPEYATWEQAASRKPCNVLLGDMCSCSHSRLHSRSQDAKGDIGKSTKDFRGEHNRKEASTLPRVEQHPTKGHVHHDIHLEDQGDLRLAWLDKRECR